MLTQSHLRHWILLCSHFHSKNQVVFGSGFMDILCVGLYVHDWHHDQMQIYPQYSWYKRCQLVWIPFRTTFDVHKCAHLVRPQLYRKRILLVFTRGTFTYTSVSTTCTVLVVSTAYYSVVCSDILSRFVSNIDRWVCIGPCTQTSLRE